MNKILLSNTVELFKIVRSKIDERLLNTFDNAIVFIFDINNYTASICDCVKVLSILRHKINNTRSILNELKLIITELKNVHDRDKNKICLKY